MLECQYVKVTINNVTFGIWQNGRWQHMAKNDMLGCHVNVKNAKGPDDNVTYGKVTIVKVIYDV